MTKETRGSGRKYQFDGLKAGEYLRFPAGNINAIRGSLTYYIKTNNLKWKWRTYMDDDGSVVVIRNK